MPKSGAKVAESGDFGVRSLGPPGLRVRKLSQNVVQQKKGRMETGPSLWFRSLSILRLAE
jgi:hypothetical protein